MKRFNILIALLLTVGIGYASAEMPKEKKMVKVEVSKHVDQAVKSATTSQIFDFGYVAEPTGETIPEFILAKAEKVLDAHKLSVFHPPTDSNKNLFEYSKRL